ncbi:MAG: hypothetical protein A2586_01485 [Candidatus Harrisonbacteria bacterium RIFOXYD1_FULL_40_9]|uniref:Uncharacterized protein n=1 Tax=Candidatus Harrisonbacteria bacterium RIFOXYD1_FULL_40_9 TaxID=1798412 RepID=A0A1G1ZZ20_9BACT|nr:MAG: hypothetical protein A2586_01485 [Candidatus Harrisonbacteria bacterium RIFOXYD1_FULL_40_9]
MSEIFKQGVESGAEIITRRVRDELKMPQEEAHLMKKKGDLHADQYLVESVFNSEIIDQFGAQLWEDYKAVKTDGQAHALEKLVRMYEALHEGNPFCLLLKSKLKEKHLDLLRDRYGKEKDHEII